MSHQLCLVCCFWNVRKSVSVSLYMHRSQNSRITAPNLDCGFLKPTVLNWSLTIKSQQIRIELVAIHGFYQRDLYEGFLNVRAHKWTHLVGLIAPRICWCFPLNSCTLSWCIRSSPRRAWTKDTRRPWTGPSGGRRRPKRLVKNKNIMSDIIKWECYFGIQNTTLQSIKNAKDNSNNNPQPMGECQLPFTED